MNSSKGQHCGLFDESNCHATYVHWITLNVWDQEQVMMLQTVANLWMSQCSPYQAVTGKIYHLKQHFLPRAVAWRFTKIKEVLLKNTQVVIWSNYHHATRKWMTVWTYLSIHSFFFYLPHILEREHWRHYWNQSF